MLLKYVGIGLVSLLASAATSQTPRQYPVLVKEPVLKGNSDVAELTVMNSESVQILLKIIEDESQPITKARMSALVGNDCLRFSARILSDPPSFRLWRRARIAVSLSDEQEKAFSILRKHISTYIDYREFPPETHRSHARTYAVQEIPNSIYLSYNFPAYMTGDFLLASSTLEGAGNLLSEWTNKPLPAGLHIEDMRHGLRYYAARALAIQNNPECIAKLRTYYQQLFDTASPHSEDSWFIETYTEVFAYVDVVAERGRDYALSLRELGMEDRDRIIGKYAAKYIDEHKARKDEGVLGD